MTTILTIAIYSYVIVTGTLVGLGFYVTSKQFWAWATEKGLIVEVGDDCPDFKDYNDCPDYGDSKDYNEAEDK